MRYGMTLSAYFFGTYQYVALEENLKTQDMYK